MVAAALVAATVAASTTVAASAATLVATTITASAVAASAATLVASAVASATVSATVTELALRASAAKTVIAGSAIALKTTNLIFYGLEFYSYSFDLSSIEGHLHFIDASQGYVEVALLWSTVHTLNIAFSEASGFAQEIFQGKPRKAVGFAHVD